jgi:hypothetical protein
LRLFIDSLDRLSQGLNGLKPRGRIENDANQALTPDRIVALTTYLQRAPLSTRFGNTGNTKANNAMHKNRLLTEWVLSGIMPFIRNAVNGSTELDALYILVII